MGKHLKFKSAYREKHSDGSGWVRLPADRTRLGVGTKECSSSEGNQCELLSQRSILRGRRTSNEKWREQPNAKLPSERERTKSNLRVKMSWRSQAEMPGTYKAGPTDCKPEIKCIAAPGRIEVHECPRSEMSFQLSVRETWDLSRVELCLLIGQNLSFWLVTCYSQDLSLENICKG